MLCLKTLLNFLFEECFSKFEDWIMNMFKMVMLQCVCRVTRHSHLGSHCILIMSCTEMRRITVLLLLHILLWTYVSWEFLCSPCPKIPIWSSWTILSVASVKNSKTRRTVAIAPTFRCSERAERRKEVLYIFKSCWTLYVSPSLWGDLSILYFLFV